MSVSAMLETISNIRCRVSETLFLSSLFFKVAILTESVVGTGSSLSTKDQVKPDSNIKYYAYCNPFIYANVVDFSVSIFYNVYREYVRKLMLLLLIYAMVIQIVTKYGGRLTNFLYFRKM